MTDARTKMTKRKSMFSIKANISKNNYLARQSVQGMCILNPYQMEFGTNGLQIKVKALTSKTYSLNQVRSSNVRQLYLASLVYCCARMSSQLICPQRMQHYLCHYLLAAANYDLRLCELQSVNHYISREPTHFRHQLKPQIDINIKMIQSVIQF